jgi:hypothetical protein
MRAMAVTLLIGLSASFLRPARVTYWVQAPGEYDFVVKDHLGVDHERVCGMVTRNNDPKDAAGADAAGRDSADKDAGLWDTVTMTSAGAHVGISRSKLPLDAAKLAAEQDCR